MSAWTTLLLALGAGAGLGAVFFAGLWWTVARLGRTRRPGLLLAGSLLLRMAFALGGFYLVARAGWRPLLSCLLGFLLARAAVVWWTRASGPPAATRGVAP
jgi:F1F0 ATPase subunit 2